MATVTTYTSEYIDGLLQELASSIAEGYVTAETLTDYLKSEALQPFLQTATAEETYAKITALSAFLTATSANATYIRVVDAGTNLNVARPANAVAVLFRFSVGVVVGTGGANIVNRQVGDLYFVADA